MKSVLIADITTLTEEEKIYGHFAKVAKQYEIVLSEKYNVLIGGGKTYLNHFPDDKVLRFPYSILRSHNYGRIKNKFQNKMHEFINACVALKSDCDIIVFQNLNETPVYLALLLFHKSRVYMIQYQKGLTGSVKKILYGLVKKHIRGVIASSEAVGEFYQRPYVVVPDYFPMNKEHKGNQKTKYDALIIGTINSWKDYESVIRFFSGTDLTLVIAGKFNDKKYLENLRKGAKENITFIDKYLTDDEYISLIEESKFIILPYKSQYEEKSSGVLLEALYNNRPVIVPDMKSFKIVKEFNLGIVYKKFDTELLEQLKDEKAYQQYKEALSDFMKKQEEGKGRLLDFIGE